MYSSLLREKGGGELEGQPLTATAAHAKAKGQTVKEFRPKGGESWNDVFERVRKFLTLVFAQNLFAKQAGVLVVTHGGWIMEFQNFLKELRKTPRNATNSTKNTALYHVHFSLSAEAVTSLEPLLALPDEEGKVPYEPSEEAIAALQAALDFEIKILNDDSHLTAPPPPVPARPKKKAI